MAKAGIPNNALLGNLAKWVLVPAALGAVGYFILGPKLAEAPPSVQQKLRELENQVLPPAAKPDAAKPGPKPALNPAPVDPGSQALAMTAPNPQQSVRRTVETTHPSPVAASRSKHATHRRKRHRKHVAAPAKQPTLVKVNPPDSDDGSFGGTEESTKPPPKPTDP
jgi:hypothetical protein